MIHYKMNTLLQLMHLCMKLRLYKVYNDGATQVYTFAAASFVVLDVTQLLLPRQTPNNYKFIKNFKICILTLVITIKKCYN